MKIGLLGVEDPSSVMSFSGTPFHLSYYLRAAGHEVRYLGPYPIRYRLFVRMLSRLSKIFTGKYLLWQRHPLIARQYAGIVDAYAKQNPDLDLLLGTSAFYLAGARTKIPLAFWGDTTVAGVIGSYAGYTGLSAKTLAQAHAVEQEALDATDLAIFSNEWAADVAIRSYRIDPAQVHVITYGAHILETPGEEEIARCIAKRRRDGLEILLLGTDWRRKGIDIAIEVVEEMRRRGRDVRLTIAGCKAPASYVAREYVSVLGMIHKTTPEGVERLRDLLRYSHVLLLPTRADCAAVVLAEASAFGLPVVSSDVGGNASLVCEGQNGFVVPIDAPLGVWIDAIERIVHDRDDFERFSWSAYRYFKSELSWENSLSRFEELVRKELLEKHSGENISCGQPIPDESERRG